jgi:hypothetical protein
MKRVKRSLNYLFVTILVMLFVGCSSKEGKIEIINGEKLKKENLLTRNDTIFLVNGSDGMKKTYLKSIVNNTEEIALGSGESSLNIEYNLLSERTSKILVEKNILTEDKALEIAKLNNSNYLIYSRTEKWNDPLGITCTLPFYVDEASVVISLYSVKDKKMISTTRLSNADCPAKINGGIPLSTLSPESLFEELFVKWLDENFQNTIKNN